MLRTFIRDDCISLSVVPSPRVGVIVADRDLVKVSGWCVLREMKLNSNKKDQHSLQVTHNASPVTPINY